MSRRRLYNYIEKNIALMKKAPRITAYNLSPLQREPKLREKGYGRRGATPWGHENPFQRELGDDGHNPPWYLWVATKPIKNSGLHFEKLTLGKIQYYIDRGLLNPSKITMFDLVSNNLVNIPDDHYGVELSIQGISLFEARINIEVSMACERTIEAIERNGGTVLTRWYSKDQLKAMKEGEDLSHKVELPPLGLVHKYLDPNLRGYIIGREDLYFRDQEKGRKILDHIREMDDTQPNYSEDHNDILQERIDANIARVKEHLSSS